MNSVTTFWQPQMEQFAHEISPEIILFLVQSLTSTCFWFKPRTFYLKTCFIEWNSIDIHLKALLAPKIPSLHTYLDLTNANVSHQNGHKSFSEFHCLSASMPDKRIVKMMIFIILNNWWGPHLALDYLFTMKHSLLHKQTSFLTHFSPFAVSRSFYYSDSCR